MSTTPFDVVTKALLDARPAELWSLLQLPGEPPPLSVVDADLATVSGAADKAIKVMQPFAGAPHWMLHAEPQRGHNLDMLIRMPYYKFALQRRHECVVASVLLLLHPDANSPQFTGEIEQTDPLGRISIVRYTVIRLWQVPVRLLLEGTVGLMVLAPLADLQGATMPNVIERIRHRADAEIADPLVRGDFWTSIGVLLGLRFDQPGEAANLLRGVQGMEQSTFWREIADTGEVRGRINEARQTVIDLGTELLGAPDEETLDTLNLITDVARLRRIWRRVLRVRTWELALREPAETPTP